VCVCVCVFVCVCVCVCVRWGGGLPIMGEVSFLGTKDNLSWLT
jgi:hypothetical protein